MLERCASRLRFAFLLPVGVRRAAARDKRPHSRNGTRQASRRREPSGRTAERRWIVPTVSAAAPTTSTVNRTIASGSANRKKPAYRRTSVQAAVARASAAQRPAEARGASASWNRHARRAQTSFVPAKLHCAATISNTGPRAALREAMVWTIRAWPLVRSATRSRYCNAPAPLIAVTSIAAQAVARGKRSARAIARMGEPFANPPLTALFQGQSARLSPEVSPSSRSASTIEAEPRSAAQRALPSRASSILGTRAGRARGRRIARSVANARNSNRKPASSRRHGGSWRCSSKSIESRRNLTISIAPAALTR